MKKIYTIAITIFIGTHFIASAQTNLTMQAAGLVQNMNLNPALAPENAFLSIPLLGSSSLEFRNGFSYNDVIKNINGVKYLDTRNMVNTLAKNGDIMAMNWNVDIVNTGFFITKDKKNFLGINLATKLHIATSTPEGLFEFLLDNPISDINRTFNISATPNILGWTEFGVSYSRVINDNFRVGARLKFLMGMAQIESQGVNFTMQKYFGGYQLSGDFAINGGNINLASNDYSKVASNMFTNPGVAADLGVEYVSKDRHLSAMASVSDLGAIFWNAANSSQIKVKDPNAVFDFNGFGKLQGLLDGNINIAALADSVWKSFTNTVGVDTISNVALKTMIPVRFHAMAEYAIDQKYRHNVSIAFLGKQPFVGGLEYSISAGYTYRPVTGHWQLMANYTYRPNIPVGVGLGAAYTNKKFQFFLAMDNIVGIFDVKNAKAIGMQLGLNIMFGK